MAEKSCQSVHKCDLESARSAAKWMGRAERDSVTLHFKGKEKSGTFVFVEGNTPGIIRFIAVPVLCALRIIDWANKRT